MKQQSLMQYLPFNPLSILVDTPEKFAQLKSGVYDTKYRSVHITSAATPNVLLQPQYFWNSTFRSLSFISFVDDGTKNSIELLPSPRLGQAVAYFRHGENPLSGLPTNYYTYNVYYAYPAKPTIENIDSILSWIQVYRLSIHDSDDVAVQLTERSAELRRLTQLHDLYVTIQEDTYEKVSVSAFIGNLRSLHEINFYGSQMSTDQMKDFEARNPAPAGWKAWIINKLIYYRKQD